MILCSGGRFQQGQGTAWIALLDISSGQAPANFVRPRIELPGFGEVLDGSSSLSRLKQRQAQVVVSFGKIGIPQDGLPQAFQRLGTLSLTPPQQPQIGMSLRVVRLKLQGLLIEGHCLGYVSLFLPGNAEIIMGDRKVGTFLQRFLEKPQSGIRIRALQRLCPLYYQTLGAGQAKPEI